MDAHGKRLSGISMYRIGVIGCGKLGMPIAMVMAQKHDVVGYDVSSDAKEILASRKYPHREIGAQELLETTKLRMVDTVDDAVAHSDMCFVAVQTPHRPEFEGVTRLPKERADFDYSYLKSAVLEIAATAEEQKKNIIVVIMSTVLPGTIDREIRPLLNEFTHLVYNPAFPAMGTTIEDFENPEFVLLGRDMNGAARTVRKFYSTITDAPIVEMSITSAEATKVFYNSFISAKIALANTWMEICQRTGADVDDVSFALTRATSRVLSPRYMRGGMSDAGPCHPRDLIALSWLSQKLEMTYDLFGDLAKIREQQTEWLAKLCFDESCNRGLPIMILGKAYKKGTNLTVGSAATLLKNIIDSQLKDRVALQHDPYIDKSRSFDFPAVFVIATNHDEFYSMKFPPGSVVIDPWGQMINKEGCEVIRVGRK